MEHSRLFANVIMPLKFRETVTYSIPQELVESVVVGSRVKVALLGRFYYAVVAEISKHSDYPADKVRDIISLEDFPPISPSEILFWKAIASYYLCSIGEVYKAAYTHFVKRDTSKQSIATKHKAEEPDVKPVVKPPTLSQKQKEALSSITEAFNKSETLLFDGSDTIERCAVYIKIAQEYLENGKSVLILIPENEITPRWDKALKSAFGENLIYYTSSLSPAKKNKAILSMIGPKVIVGQRPAIFLQIPNLELTIVEHEHESAYKQIDPTPRYNGRDVAMIKSSIQKTKVLLCSSTPSFESLYNVQIGKYKEVKLDNDRTAINIETIDMSKEKRHNAVKGLFSFRLIKEIKQRFVYGESIAIYRPTWALPASEEVESEILNLFGENIHNILLISEISGVALNAAKVSLLVFLQGELLFLSQDFRCDERAIQLLTKANTILKTFCAEAKIIIQTLRPSNKVFDIISKGESPTKLIDERREFNFPPFSRMIQLILRERFEERLERNCEYVAKTLSSSGIKDYSGPIASLYETSSEEKTMIFRFFLPKNRQSELLKADLYKLFEESGRNIIIDVDPI